MASIAPISHFDGANPPVAHVFVPVSVSREGKDKVRAEWRETGLAVPTIAQPRLTMTLERLKSGVYRAERRIVVPVMEATNGANAAGYTAAPKVAHELTDVRTFFFHERSDVASRRLVRQLGVNIDGQVTTTVTPTQIGPLAELCDLLVTPT